MAALVALALAPSAFAWSVRTVPGLTSGGGSGGPLVPEVPGVVLDGSNGLSTSLRPTLHWPNGPSGQKNYEIRDLSGKSVWRFGASGDAKVSAGVLKQGGAYTWRATGDGKSFDGGLVRVDMQRSSVQGAPSYGGVSVAAVSGEAVFSWSSGRLSAVGGETGLTLSFQPSNTQLIAPARGLPAGWQITAGGGSEWSQLKLKSEGWAELISSSGAAVPFARGSGGLWVAQLGTGQNWPAGSQVSLSRAGDGTWSASDRNGVVTLFPALTKTGGTVWARKVWAAGEPSVQQSFDSSGHLTAITDPVSNRSIRLIYRGVNESGSLSCSQAEAAHQKIAPPGYLCLTSGWESPPGIGHGHGSKPQQNRFFYAGNAGKTVLARIVGEAQGGGKLASATDLAYDSVGRLKALREPLSTRAVAASVLKGKPSADDPNVLTTISYHGDGKAAQVTRPAPMSVSRTGTRAWRSFSWSTDSGTTTQIVRGYGTSQVLGEIKSQLSTMLATKVVDNAGRVTTTQWDPDLQAPKQINSPGGFVEKFSYDGLGNLIQQRGPSTAVDSSSAPVATTSYDTELSGTDEVPVRGLQVLYYKGRQFQGAPLSHQTGPKIGSTEAVKSLLFSWPGSPIGSTNPDWSARLFGYVVVPQDGDLSFTAATGTSLWIAGQLCSPTCERKGLKADQLLPIQVQAVSAVSGTGSLFVTWSGPGASGAVPTSSLRPGYTLPSQQKVADALSPGAGVQTLATAIQYSSNDPSRVVSARSPSGLTAQRSYEPYNPQGGQFGRSEKFTSAADLKSSATYFGQHDVATAPASCPEVGGQSFDQAGMLREKALIGGIDTSQIYDNAGRVVAQRQNGQLSACAAFDGAGNKVLSWSPANGSSPAVTVKTAYNASENPLRTVNQSSQGSTVRSSSARIDILGHQISATDVWNTTTVIEYDAFDRPIKSTSKTGTKQQTVTTSTYRDSGQLGSVIVDGKTLASYSYNDAGQMIGATYSNGSSVSFSYDSSGNLIARKLKIGGREITESVGLSPGGRTLTRSLSAPGTDSSWSYSYDRDGRLSSADLTGTVPDGVATGSWVYQLDAASRREAITRPGTGPGTGRVTFSYGDASEIEGTSDPRFGVQGDAQFEYDSRDRATKAGALKFKYDATGVVSQVTDGKTTVDYLLSGGQVIGQTITSTDAQTGKTSSRSVRYSAQGLVMCPKCETGTALSRLVPLPGGVTIDIPIVRATAKKVTPKAVAGEAAATAAAKPPTAPAEAAQSSEPTWRYADMLGDVAWQVTGSQSPATTTLYDPDGNQLTAAPPLSLDPTIPNLRFRGQNTAPTEVPVLAMGSRSYIPALGLFMQPDPVPNGGPTPYNFANGDPINFNDPGGNVAWCWSTFTKVTIGVVVGVTVGALTGGAGLSVGAAIAANALGGLGAALVSQGTVVLAQIPDADGNVQSDINWWEVATETAVSGAFGGVSAAIGNKISANAAAKAAAASESDKLVDDFFYQSIVQPFVDGAEYRSGTVIKQSFGNLKDDALKYQLESSSDFISSAKGLGKAGEDAADIASRTPTEQAERLFADPNRLPEFFKLPPGFNIGFANFQ
jgi:RHS repeat-associated protein